MHEWVCKKVEPWTCRKWWEFAVKVQTATTAVIITLHAYMAKLLAVCTFAPPQIFFGVTRVIMVLNDGYRYSDTVLLLSSKQRPRSRSLRYSRLKKKSTEGTDQSTRRPKIMPAEIARGNSAHNGRGKEGKDITHALILRAEKYQIDSGWSLITTSR